MAQYYASQQGRPVDEVHKSHIEVLEVNIQHKPKTR